MRLNLDLISENDTITMKLCDITNCSFLATAIQIGQINAAKKFVAKITDTTGQCSTINSKHMRPGESVVEFLCPLSLGKKENRFKVSGLMLYQYGSPDDLDSSCLYIEVEEGTE